MHVDGSTCPSSAASDLDLRAEVLEQRAERLVLARQRPGSAPASPRRPSRRRWRAAHEHAAQWRGHRGYAERGLIALSVAGPAVPPRREAHCAGCHGQPADDALLGLDEVAAWLEVDSGWVARAIARDALPVLGFGTGRARDRRRGGAGVVAAPDPHGDET